MRDITPVIKKSRSQEEEYEVCPHCMKEIREKEHYVDADNYVFHSPCLIAGPIDRLKPVELRWAGDHFETIEIPEAEQKFEEVKIPEITAKKKSKKKKKSEDWDPNPWAVCTESIGGVEGTTERSKWDDDAKERYERCVKHVKKDQGKAASVKTAGEDWVVTEEMEDLAMGVVNEIMERGGYAGAQDNKVRAERFPLDPTHQIPIEIELYEGTYEPDKALVNVYFFAQGQKHPIPCNPPRPEKNAVAIVDAIKNGFMELVNMSRASFDGIVKEAQSLQEENLRAENEKVKEAFLGG